MVAKILYNKTINYFKIATIIPTNTFTTPTTNKGTTSPNNNTFRISITPYNPSAFNRATIYKVFKKKTLATNKLIKKTIIYILLNIIM